MGHNLKQKLNPIIWLNSKAFPSLTLSTEVLSLFKDSHSSNAKEKAKKLDSMMDASHDVC